MKIWCYKSEVLEDIKEVPPKKVMQWTIVFAICRLHHTVPLTWLSLEQIHPYSSSKYNNNDIMIFVRIREIFYEGY